jgi:hypothetical protein
MKKRILALSAILLFVISTSAYANNVSVAAKISTLGLGGEGEVSVTDSIGIRAGFNYFTYSFSATEGAIDYDFDLNLMSVPILIDYHPLKGSFRLTAGAIYNGNNFDAKANYAGSIDIGGTIYTLAQIGDMKAEIEFNAFAPYLGFGWDTTYGKERGFGFSFEAGALFQGEPDATFTTTGLLASDPTLLADLATEEQQLQDALNNFKIFPVVSFGINYRF